MTVRPTGIDGLLIIGLEPYVDDRGSFIRVFDRGFFLKRGLCGDYAQHGAATNSRRGIVRGLHYQTAPFAEHKVVRCTQGAVWDVVVDARRSSPTFGRWEAFELRGEVPQMLYLTAGLAHGYQTLTSESQLHYLLSVPYAPKHAAGILWRDPGLAIAWPLRETLVSERDEALPTLDHALDATP